MIHRFPGRCFGIALVFVVAACTTTPRDDYRGAQALLGRGDLPGALRRFDAVPVSDLRYPEARLAAAALERRLRRHAELVLEGLRLRGEWRDREAIDAFRGALDAWPEHAATEELIAATEQRRQLMAGLRQTRPGETVGAGEPAATKAPGDQAPPRVTTTATKETTKGAAASGAVTAPAGESAPSATGDDEVAAAPEYDTGAPVAAEPELEGADAELPEPGAADLARRPSSGAIGSELAQIEARTSVGELDRVLADLQALHRQFPDDPRVSSRLARMLQQRGLLLYGEGQVAGAIEDWQRASQLDPRLRSARVLLQLASRELSRPPR